MTSIPSKNPVSFAPGGADASGPAAVGGAGVAVVGAAFAGPAPLVAFAASASVFGFDVFVPAGFAGVVLVALVVLAALVVRAGAGAAAGGGAAPVHYVRITAPA